MILLNQAGRNRHEDICEALELFAAEVMPEFHAMEPEHQEWKRGVLAGEIELDEIDTDAVQLRHEPDAGVEARAGRRQVLAAAGIVRPLAESRAGSPEPSSTGQA